MYLYAIFFYYNIFFSGETTAGKSSLLNLLLGSDCLPHSLLTCTTTICRLRNKDEKKIIITDKANVTTELDLPQDVDAACMKSMLKKYVSSGVGYDQYNYVDIHWPIPILKVGVVSLLIQYFLCRYSPDYGDRMVVGFATTYAELSKSLSCLSDNRSGRCGQCVRPIKHLPDLHIFYNFN